MATDKEKAFLKDLRKLAIKHGIVIDGCGCCGSPYLSNAPDDAQTGFYVYDDQVEFVHPSDKHTWGEYKNWWREAL